jgi:hypothetical protein
MRGRSQTEQTMPNGLVGHNMLLRLSTLEPLRTDTCVEKMPVADMHSCGLEASPETGPGAGPTSSPHLLKTKTSGHPKADIIGVRKGSRPTHILRDANLFSAGPPALNFDRMDRNRLH